VEWISATAVLLTDAETTTELLAGGPDHRDVEHFYLRAAAFGYTLFDRPLERSLRDRAVRLWLARAMAVLGGDDPGPGAGARQPLARIDAMFRAYGIGNYVEDVAAALPGVLE
jgi:hypothetical protein